jgi:hypothetical protein
MGWWMQDAEGHSFADGGELLWGDGPADTLDAALEEIIKEFEDTYRRRPTKAELRSGLEFGIGNYDENKVPA